MEVLCTDSKFCLFACLFFVFVCLNSRGGIVHRQQVLFVCLFVFLCLFV